jgi:hypothetical protein
LVGPGIKQVLVVLVPLDESLDEWTQRPDPAAGSGANVVKGTADQGGGHALALIRVGDLGVGEGDEPVVEGVRRKPASASPSQTS